jgi:hypothetical protein
MIIPAGPWNRSSAGPIWVQNESALGRLRPQFFFPLGEKSLFPSRGCSKYEPLSVTQEGADTSSKLLFSAIAHVFHLKECSNNVSRLEHHSQLGFPIFRNEEAGGPLVHQTSFSLTCHFGPCESGPIRSDRPGVRICSRAPSFSTTPRK